LLQRRCTFQAGAQVSDRVRIALERRLRQRGPSSSMVSTPWFRTTRATCRRWR
jgi:hypothetical protein